MSDLISREEVLNLIDTAFESGAFDGRYAYENLIDAVQNLIHPLETDLISRTAALEFLEEECSLIMFDSYGNLTFAGERITEAIHELPSVKPEFGELIRYSVHGHNACKCSKCDTDLGYPYAGKFCKWCGARLVEVIERQIQNKQE